MEEEIKRTPQFEDESLKKLEKEEDIPGTSDSESSGSEKSKSGIIKDVIEPEKQSSSIEKASNPIEETGNDQKTSSIEKSFEQAIIPPLKSSKKSSSSSSTSSSSSPISFMALPNESNGIPGGDKTIDSEPIEESTGLTKRQLITLVNFALVELLSAIVISLQAPFYPAEAEKKGATATEFGLVFGIFELVVFLTSPIYGKYMDQIGPKTVFNCGIFTTGTCSILFGFLDRIDDRTSFIAMSFIVRVVEALGEAAFVTASFTIIALEFPNSVASTFASMETFYGLGLIVGPTLGGALFGVGGFTLPFVVLGGLLFVSAILTALVLPKGKSSTLQEELEKQRVLGGNRFGYFKLLVIPSVALSAFSIVASSISIGYISATLEPHIRNFDLNPVVLGSIFVISGGMYALSAPIWGWLADKEFCQPKIISLIGTLFIIAGVSLVGPLPFIPLEKMLWLICIGLGLHGLGLGSTLVSAFIQALRDALHRGFPDNTMTYGLISGMWVSMFSLGAFIGPSVAGVLYDWVGFETGSLFVVGVQLIVTFLLLAFIFVTCNNNQRSGEESHPLLKEDSKSIPRPSTSYGSVS